MKPSEYIEKGWCQGCFAIDSEGKHVLPDNPSAVAWCLIGATARSVADGTLSSEEEVEIYRAIFMSGISRCQGFIEWNDAPGRTKEEVLALLKEVERKVLDGQVLL